MPPPRDELQTASVALIPPATQTDEDGERDGDGEADDEACAVFVAAGVAAGGVKTAALPWML